MAETSFQNVIIIGYGALAYNTVRLCHEASSRYGFELMYIEHEMYPFNAAKYYVDSKGISSAVLENKEDVLNCLLDKSERKTLIISASNNYLFPKCIVEQPKATIINFHNALLPKYPGRNAASWAIYYEETETGITWHYVSVGIDDGDVIMQKSCAISENMKAYELAETLMNLGAEGLSECLDAVLRETVQVKKQPTIENRKLYKAVDVPNDGIILVEDKPEHIYRLLRAMDYGQYRIFPMPRMIYGGREIFITGYELIDTRLETYQSNTMWLPYDDTRILVLRYE